MKNLFLLILCIFTFSSCSNDGEIFTITSVSNESVDSKPVLKTIEFSYKDKFYSSEYYQEGDSVFILDYETQKVYDELGKNESKFVFVSDNDKITYFDSESEYLENEKSKLQLRSTSSAPYIRVVVRLYKNYDSFFTPTTSMLIERTHTRMTYGSTRNIHIDSDLVLIPDLKVYDHNDNISLAKLSIYIGNMGPHCNFRGEVGLWMYEHINYEGNMCAGWAAAAWNDLQNPMKSGEEIHGFGEIKVKAIHRFEDGYFDYNDSMSSLKITLSYTNMNWDGSSTTSGRG